LNPCAWRSHFPLLQNRGATCVYLDNAATTQKPQQVIDAELQFYTHFNANIHRANHHLAREATHVFETIRSEIAQFIGAQDKAEIIWTRGTTESINLIAHSYGRYFLNPGDEILISAMEHHANIVPWQLVAQAVGAVIKIIPVNERGTIDLFTYQALFTPQTRLVCLCHVSNALGTLNPIQAMIDIAHQHHALTCIDGAQAIAHIPVDMTALDCDFYAFSGHKMYGPTGIGVLYGKRGLLEQMPPYQAGGEMIQQVSFEKTTFNTLPFKFEAGTPNIAGVIGLGAAVRFITSLEREAVQQHEADLLHVLHKRLASLPGCQVLSPPDSCGLVSFIFDGVHPNDLATLLDEKGIAVRSGTHCAMPFFQSRGVVGAVRVSIGCYTTQEEIEAFFQALDIALEILL
jgi:cysteine sulfinate desulfinase/cysteine desulfurase/selenocysteine lyase